MTKSGLEGHAEQPAAGRERLFEQILARLPQGVVVVDRRLVVEYANPAYERIIGARVPPGDPLEDHWAGVSLRELATTTLDAGPTDARLVSVADRILSLESMRSGLHVIVLLEDVTQRERQRRSEQEFLENAAHELRTPLAAIVSVTDVLESGAKEIPEVRDRFLRHIRVHSDRLSRLATSFLTLARLQTGLESPRRELAEVEPILRTVAGDLEAQPGVEVIVDVPGDLATVTDPQLLHRVLANLADNAAKHTLGGEIVLAGRHRGDAVELEVRDTGAGMTETEVARAFDRFYRGSHDGAGFGLGLAIADESVHALGGRIELESEPGVGTRFRVLLPTARLVAS